MADYKPGDVVNGHVLTQDMRWVPIQQPQQQPTYVARPLPSYPRPPVQSKPMNRGVIALIVVACVLLPLAVFAVAVIGGRSSSPQASAPQSAGKPSTGTVSRGTTTTGKRDVAYEVTGEGTSSVDVTYRNETGGTDNERAANLPYRYFLRLESGDFASVFAQNAEESGSITCILKVDEVVVASQTSRGAFAVASCSAFVR